LWISIEADQGDVVMQTNWKWLGRDLCIAVILSAEKRGAGGTGEGEGVNHAELEPGGQE
jgi:hypothetical protein